MTIDLVKWSNYQNKDFDLWSVSLSQRRAWMFAGEWWMKNGKSDHFIRFAIVRIHFLAFIFSLSIWSKLITSTSFPPPLLFRFGDPAALVWLRCNKPECSYKLESVRKLHCSAPFSSAWFVEGNLSHKQPRGDFNIYSAVCSAYVSFGKQLTLAHYTQMKADLQTGQRPHSLCGEVSPSYEAMAFFFSPSSSSCLAYAYGTAARPHCKREGPRWHDVYCTSIWYWCILRCKQGFKLYAPPCQRLRVTLTICLSAGGWEGRGVQAGVRSRVRVSVCIWARVYLLEPRVWFLPLLVLMSPLKCMANSCFESHHGDVTA